MQKARGCIVACNQVNLKITWLLHAMSSDCFQNVSNMYEHVERSFNPWGDLADHILLKVNFSFQAIIAFHATRYSNISLET